MTPAQCLRAWRPSIRTIRAPVASQALRTGRSPFSSYSRLRRDDEVARASAQAGDGQAQGRRQQGPGRGSVENETEFKKQRAHMMESPEFKELFSQTHPRLETREGRTSITKFKKSWHTQKPPNPDKLVTLYGRIESIRRHGNKLAFITIVNEHEKVQGMISLKKVQPISKDAFKLFLRLIARGDHIALTGRPAHSDTGALIVEATSIPELLSPVMEPIPESLTDPETKAQKRHVDMLVNPDVADTLRLKSHIMQYIRDHFVQDDFLEVQTPILAHNAGGAVARPFVSRATEFPQKELSLRVAPELWLKRLVVGGLNKVFEMGPCFRNEGIDATHNPEFTMCEFYSAYTNLRDLMGITESLLGGLARHCDDLIRTKLTSLQPVDTAKFAAPFEEIEFVPALEEALGFRLPSLSGADALPEIVAVLKLGGIPLPGGDVPATLPKLLDRLAAVYLEPRSFDRPAFITHHPACMSPLAKSFLCRRTGQLVSARAELFIDGRELANMYEEENDPVAQARKLAEHRALSARKSVEDMETEARREKVVRSGEEDVVVLEDDAEVSTTAEEKEEKEEKEEEWEDADKDAAPLDKSYIKAMEAGLPPTGGWGCGVERLVMLFSGANRISDCLTFGTLRNVVGLTSEGGAGEGSNEIENEKGEGEQGGNAAGKSRDGEGQDGEKSV